MVEAGARYNSERWLSWWSALRYPVGLFVVMRVALTLWTLVVVNTPGMAPTTDELVGADAPASAVENYLVKSWARWDTDWYIKIAGRGYAADDGSIAFFPLYPLLIRVLSFGAPGAQLWAALLIGNLAALGCFVLLYSYVRRHFGELTARGTLLFWAAFPTAFFLVAGYTEALFLFWTLLAFFAADEGKWGWVGIAVGLAALTRLPGLALVAPLSVVWWRQHRDGKSTRREGLIALSLALGLAASYWVYLQITFDDASIWSRSMAHCCITGLPGQSIVLMIQKLAEGETFALANNVLDVAAAFFLLLMVLWNFFDLPLPLAVCSAVLLLIPLTSIQTVVPQMPLASMPRYGLILFPIFITLARRVPVGLMHAILVVWLVLQMGLLALFVRGVWVA